MVNSPTSNFLREDERIGSERFDIPDSKSVDAVYYGQFDLEKARTFARDDFNLGEIEGAKHL